MRNEEASDELEAILRVPHLRQIFSSMMRVVVILSIPVAAVLFFMGPQLIRLLSHEKFLDAAAIFPWTAPFPILFLTTYILGRGMMALDRSLYLGAMTLLSSVINIVLNFMLIPKYGEAGTAVATSISLFALVLLLGRAMRLRQWITLEDLMPWRLLIYSIVSFCAVGLIGRWEPVGGVFTLLLGGLVCLVILLALGLLRRSDIDLLTGSFSERV
jgi:O-antigen/teichoic acid export membrane protein